MLHSPAGVKVTAGRGRLVNAQPTPWTIIIRMAEERRSLRNGRDAGEGTGSDAGQVQKKLLWNVKRVKFTLALLMAFTTGCLLMSFVTQRSGTSWKTIPLPFSLSMPTQGGSSQESQQDGRVLTRPYDPREGDFLHSESFQSFVKKKAGNVSSVTEYLLSVSHYLLTFRSPMIRENASQYSWPETETERKYRESISKTKHIVYYNPPGYFKSLVSGKNPFAICPVKSCEISLNYNRDHSHADAIVFLGGPGPRALPRDHADQLFVFMTMESPQHTGSGYGKTDWNSAFNWSWNFRTDSDIFEPVGYLKRTPSPPSHNTLLTLKRQKKKYVAWMSSNCQVQSKRDQYVRRLRKVIPVDIYGRCGNLSCRRNDRKCSTLLNDYLFYLSFENSMCTDYITEKFYKTFYKDLHVLSVVRGGANYSRFFPSGTFIDAESFPSPEDLGRYLLSLAQDEADYVDMLWRRAHLVYHEHGIVDSFCQLCYKLHHWQRFKKTYPDLYGWYHAHGCSSPRPF